MKAAVNSRGRCNARNDHGEEGARIAFVGPACHRRRRRRFGRDGSEASHSVTSVVLSGESPELFTTLCPGVAVSRRHHGLGHDVRSPWRSERRFQGALPGAAPCGRSARALVEYHPRSTGKCAETVTASNIARPWQTRAPGTELGARSHVGWPSHRRCVLWWLRSWRRLTGGKALLRNRLTGPDWSDDVHASASEGCLLMV